MPEGSLTHIQIGVNHRFKRPIQERSLVDADLSMLQPAWCLATGCIVVHQDVTGPCVFLNNAVKVCRTYSSFCLFLLLAGHRHSEPLTPTGEAAGAKMKCTGMGELEMPVLSYAKQSKLWFLF